MQKGRTSHLLVSLLILIPTQCLFLPANSFADYLALSWSPNHEADLAGYRVYYGKFSRNYDDMTDVGNTSSCTLSGLEANSRYYVALTAYDTFGNESDFSNEVSGVPHAEPPTPTPSHVQTGSEEWYAEMGCFITTAAYGSYLNSRVETLRDFRDEFLISNFLRSKSVNLSYRYGPRIAHHRGKYGLFRFLTRQAPLPLTGMSSLFNKSNKITPFPTLLIPFLCFILVLTTALYSYHCRPAAPPNTLNQTNEINDIND